MPDDVVQVDAGTVRRTLRGVTRDHDILFFESVPELRDKLVPGRVVFFQGFTFKKVQAIASDGAHLIVATEPAALTDLFKDTNIRWHTSINFRDASEPDEPAPATTIWEQRPEEAVMLLRKGRSGGGPSGIHARRARARDT